MVAHEAKRIKIKYIASLCEEAETYFVYVDNVKVYCSKVFEHAKSVYKKLLEMNGENYDG